MSNELDPIVGNWYKHLDKGHRFVVVAVDQQQRLVEAQHFDGDIEEIELDNWYDMELEASEAPEDWSGPVDNIERDDTGYTETRMTSADWRDPLEEIPREPAAAAEDTTPEDERDPLGEGTGTEEPAPRELVENIELPSERRTSPRDEDESEPES